LSFTLPPFGYQQEYAIAPFGKQHENASVDIDGCRFGGGARKLTAPLDPSFERMRTGANQSSRQCIRAKNGRRRMIGNTE
jgi:hypothetical protein